MTGSFFRFALIGLFVASAGNAADPNSIDFFESKIRPILVDHCYPCHSHQAKENKKLKGGLFVDTADGLLKGGDSGPAIDRKKPTESLLIKSLRHIGELKMPPKGKLPDQVIADFAKWLELGAPDPRIEIESAKSEIDLDKGRRHWAYKPMAITSTIAENRQNTTKAIDRLVLDRLAKEKLTLAPTADRVTLIRRLTFDLIGLPPSPSEIEAFVNDTSMNSLEKLVDRLLANPAFGERWGRHWLDLARYAESLTLRGFVLKDAWRYRDYVIDSFNQDRPFDEFIREQIAGDLLPSTDWRSRRRKLIATTFLAMGNYNLEEQDKKQLELDVVDEQIDTISRAFLAQTVSCARCHDHKFDPIPTRDYYAIAGILKSTKFLNHENVSNWINRPLPMAPELESLVSAKEAKIADLKKQITAIKDSIAKSNPKPDNGKPRQRAIKDLPGIVIDDAKAKKVGEWKQSTSTGSYVGDGYLHDENQSKGEKTVTYTFDIPATGKYAVWFAYSSDKNRSDSVPVTVFSAEGEKLIRINQQRTPEIDGLFHPLGTYSFEKGGQGFVLLDTAGTKGHVIADAVVFIPVDQVPANLKATDGTPSKTTSEEKKLSDLENELKQIVSTGPQRDTALGFEEAKQIGDLEIHIRGNRQNLGPKAPRGVLQVATFGPAIRMPADQSGRKELADWIADGRNPLTARVYVNRVWHWLIGSGLVRTTDNFGSTGEQPSNPELLDYLALRFIDSGWSSKKLIRDIVLTRVYQQSSILSETSRKLDPENRLFSRANRKRLDAESLRDAILSTSGQLKEFSGGSSFDQSVSSDYGYKFDKPIRSIYVPVFRNSLPEIFTLFDFADPSVSNGRRTTSTSAPQALFFSNHPFVIDHSQLTADKVLKQSGKDESKWVRDSYLLLLGREPTPRETQIVLEYLSKSVDPKRKYAAVIQSLYGSIEFRYIH